MISQPGFNYIRQYAGHLTKKGVWQTYAGDDTFEYCQMEDCANSDEHEYAFDGQIFYKKRSK